MSRRGKTIFLIFSIVVPFLLYSVYYYSRVIKNAAYKASELESISFKYGLGDSLINQYNSETGNYQYINTNDSLVRKNVHLSEEDMLYLHRKAAQLGFWDFPSEIVPPEKVEGRNSPRYFLQFNYKRKSKQMLFDLSYEENQKLKDAARTLIQEVDKTIHDAEYRQTKTQNDAQK